MGVDNVHSHHVFQRFLSFDHTIRLTLHDPQALHRHIQPLLWHIIHSYQALRKYFIEQLESESIYSLINNSKTTFGTNLERCELKNGNIYWLCPDHVTLKNAKVLMDSVASQEINYDSNKYQINALKSINVIENVLYLFIYIF